MIIQLKLIYIAPLNTRIVDQCQLLTTVSPKTVSRTIQKILGSVLVKVNHNVDCHKIHFNLCIVFF